MEKFIIHGGTPLHGEVTPAGNKNAALPLLAACLLTDEPVILHNVPDIDDVQTMRALLESLGVEIETLDDTLVEDPGPQGAPRRPGPRPIAGRSAPRSCWPAR